MFVAITNTPRDYAWGATTAISGLLGTEPSGFPEAELWLGAHPGSPSRILNPRATGGAADLAHWIDADPKSALGERNHLPFLMKVLAAGSPLSLQAHPTARQAREGYERENALGIPPDAPHRSYRDEFPKPEIIVALSDSFEALCGFRPKAEAAEVFLALGLTDLVPQLDQLPQLLEWLMSGAPDVDLLLASLAAHVAEGTGAAAASSSTGSTVVSDAVDTVRRLGEVYPGDPGIICALLLNRVTLRKGEALHLPAGNIHAYLEGLGIEVMGASDNVLRGGLTAKHVDVPELLRVLDFAQGPPPWLHGESSSRGVTLYRPVGEEFALAHTVDNAEVALTGPAIALCVSGAVNLDGDAGSITISRGESVFITPEERNLSVTGSGELFLAMTV